MRGARVGALLVALAAGVAQAQVRINDYGLNRAPDPEGADGPAEPMVIRSRVGSLAALKADDAAAEAALAAGASTGTTTGTPRPGIIHIAPEERPWGERLREAKRIARHFEEGDLLEALDTHDDARIFAVLEICYKQRLRPPVPDLIRALRRCRDERAAHAAAYHLSIHEDPAARAEIVRHVTRRAQGHRKIRPLLGPDAGEELAAATAHFEKRSEWMRDAATAPPGSRYQLRAIRMLAEEPGTDVEALLRQLAKDSDDDVARAAETALEERERGEP